MDFNDTPEEAKFRHEVRSWLEANAKPKTAAGFSAENPRYQRNETDALKVAKAWQAKKAAKGYARITWPKEIGGMGGTPMQQVVYSQEEGKFDVPSGFFEIGLGMCIPTVTHYASKETAAKFVKPALYGEEIWFQLFSEPSAGSDVAGLRTKAERDGDDWVINGQKIWTSGAQFADMCFCLVRTDNTRKHEGISFLLIDMKSPGVEVRPIKLISGNSPFCETFFTDVKVPKENLMGPLNGGWTIGKRLLQFERQGLSGGVGGGGLNRAGEARSLDQVAKQYIGSDDKGRIADAELRTRVTNHLMDMRAFMLTVQRSMAEAKGNSSPSFTTSIMKNAGSRIGQDRAELLIEIMGNQGLGWEGEGFTRDELDTVRGWLGGKATTIYGGSAEIQNNIIAKRVLGLLDHQ